MAKTFTTYKAALLCGAALVVLPALAHAADSEFLKPRSDWKVAKVTPEGEGAPPYCVMSREYSSNITFNMALNAHKEGSLAFDYKQDVFEIGHPYQVSLQPEGDATRTYDAEPLSARAIVLQVGRDDQLFHALRDADTLNVSIDGERSDYSMINYVTGLNRMNQCLASLPTSGAVKVHVADEYSPLPEPGPEIVEFVEDGPMETAGLNIDVPVPSGKDAEETYQEQAQALGLIKRVKTLEAQTDAVKANNERLKEEVENLRIERERALLEEAQNDWDLEKATRRYNEARREVQRMAEALERERLQHERETAKIETMLFDPALTEQAQLKEMLEMQDALAEARVQVAMANQEVEKLKSNVGEVRQGGPIPKNTFSVARMMVPGMAPLATQAQTRPPHAGQVAPARIVPGDRMAGNVSRQPLPDTTQPPQRVQFTQPTTPPPQIEAAQQMPVTPIMLKPPQLGDKNVDRPLLSAEAKWVKGDIVYLMQRAKLTADNLNEVGDTVSWQSSPAVVGKLLQQDVMDSGDAHQFAVMVESALSDVRQNCLGEYSDEEAYSVEEGGTKYALYDSVCVNDSGAAQGRDAQAILFVQTEGHFKMISFATNIATMAEAMALRDTLFETVKSL